MKEPLITSPIAAGKGRPEGGDLLVWKPAKLVLADGTSFCGKVPEWQADSVAGEVVFNTGMTGYTESLTDPSYSNQILTFTYPLIGNYGVAARDTWESGKIHPRGIVVSELCLEPSHATSERALLEWLREEQVPVLTGVDTRALTKHLRTLGTVPGVITRRAKPQIQLPPFNIVTTDKPEVFNPGGRKTVIAVDCGMKENIVRHLTGLGVRVKRVPADYDYTNEEYDGLFLSNGPGDPTEYGDTIRILKKALKSPKPVFGICLGTQLLALAAGAKTYKLKFGHRGHNQPCVDTEGRGVITSQNHGYAIDAATLPRGWRVTYTNLNDGSVEGIAHGTKPLSAVQFHPEAAPGPTDTASLFKEFAELL